MSEQSDMAELDAWIEQMCAALGVDPAAVDRDALLGLAGRAAHGVVRPAAPVTTYLAGLVAGVAAAGGEEPAAGFARAVSAIDDLLDRADRGPASR